MSIEINTIRAVDLSVGARNETRSAEPGASGKEVTHMLNKLAATAVVAAAATGGILLAAAPAYADTNAGSNADTNANGTPVGADAGAAGGAKNSPGVISGNAIQVPIHLPAPLGGLDSHRPSCACIGGPAGAPACACGV